MPEIVVRHAIDTNEDTFWSKLALSNAYSEELNLHLKVGWELLGQHEDEETWTRRVRIELPLDDLPAAIKKRIPGTLSLTEDAVFDKKTKRYTIALVPNMQADKARIHGAMWCEPIGEERITRVCKLSVDVKAFLVGSLIEERVLADFKTSYDRGAAFANAYIAKHALHRR